MRFDALFLLLHIQARNAIGDQGEAQNGKDNYRRWNGGRKNREGAEIQSEWSPRQRTWFTYWAHPIQQLILLFLLLSTPSPPSTHKRNENCFNILKIYMHAFPYAAAAATLLKRHVKRHLTRVAGWLREFSGREWKNCREKSFGNHLKLLIVRPKKKDSALRGGRTRTSEKHNKQVE